MSLSHVSTPAEPTQGFQGNHSPSNVTQMATGIHVAGAALEKGLKAMKDFADLVPAAPGLGPAIGVVCGCIEVYHVSYLSLHINKLLIMNPNNFSKSPRISKASKIWKKN